MSELSIGELAKLMGISTHQVRFYEEKGLIKPSKVDTNGYRKYDIYALYQLSHILMLRDIKLPIKDILSAQSSDDDKIYIKMIEKAQLLIQDQMRELQETNQAMLAYLEDEKKAMATLNEYYFKDFEDEHYQVIHEFDLNELPTAKDVYHAYMKSDIPAYKHNMYIVTDGHTASLCIKSYDSKDLCIPKGQYLCHHVVIKDFTYIEIALRSLLAYAIDNGYEVEGLLISSEEIYNTIIHRGKEVIEVRVKVKTQNP